MRSSAITMNLTAESFSPLRSLYLPILERLAAIFSEMDHAYETVAEKYGFVCNGCKENCCQTRFYHHTLLEYLYLMEGLNTLDEGTIKEVREEAMAANDRMADADNKGLPIRVMCPLNKDGRCLSYRYRPMICRLHGIPHELRHPDGRILKNPGCDAFFDQCRSLGKTDYIPFDRTPFYRQMAMLENELRKCVGHMDKIKRTVAQMILTF